MSPHLLTGTGCL